MRTLGKFTTVVLIIATLGAIALFIHSLPDIKRYLEIREM